ncbi:MAG: signal peptidase I [Gemmatimonadales bacterium]
MAHADEAAKGAAKGTTAETAGETTGGTARGAGKRARAGTAGASGDTKPDEGFREWGRSLLVALVLFLVLRTFVVQTFVIVSASMRETLLVGDMLVANRLAVGPRIPGTQRHLPGYSTLHRGDVVVFDPHHEENMKLVKRLMGLPGDTLEMREGVLWLNGAPLDEPYVRAALIPDDASPEFSWQRPYLVDRVDPTTYRPTRDTWGPLVVPEDHYFMLGDNRDDSYDSRYWGPLASWRVEARVAFLYFSYNRDSYRPFPALREIRWSRIGRRIDGFDDAAGTAVARTGDATAR